MNDRSEQEFLERSRASFERSVEELEPTMRLRLAQARRGALASITQPTPSYLDWRWLSAGAVATVAITLITTLLWVKSPPAQSPTLIAENSADLDILLAEDDLDLYTHLEFYAWIEMQPDGG